MDSLPEAFRSVKVDPRWTPFRKFMAFAGPGYLVSVGYMDPGNWATDLAGGSRYGYQLLWVILASNLMAMLLQTLCVRLGLVTGKDLAQACRDYYKKPVALVLWFLCEIAIIACDLAEVLGSAIALNLLFGIDLIWGVLITGFDVLLLLGLMRYGFRKLEAVVIALVATIFVCFAINIYLAQPDVGGVMRGLFVPSMPNDPHALLIALGILGATVMPHNLYLHSSIVQSRAHDRSEEGTKQAVKFATMDTIIALGAAFFVNAAILILAAAVFHKGGVIVEEFSQAPEMLKPALGGLAATLFSVALLSSGQSSTITGTLAGQIVMEGFLRIRVQPWLRRLITRGLAIIPAILLITATGGKDTVKLITFSQVVLSMQLSFAIFPLLFFTSSRAKMGTFANPLWMKVVGGIVCTVIAVLNIKLLADNIGYVWLSALMAAGIGFALWVRFGFKDKSDLASV